MSAASEGPSQAQIEAAACAITRLRGLRDPYRLVMHPASKSWEPPSMPAWMEWEEEARAALAAVRGLSPEVAELREEVERLVRERDAAKAEAAELTVELRRAGRRMREDMAADQARMARCNAAMDASQADREALWQIADAYGVPRKDVPEIVRQVLAALNPQEPT